MRAWRLYLIFSYVVLTGGYAVAMTDVSPVTCLTAGVSSDRFVTVTLASQSSASTTSSSAASSPQTTVVPISSIVSFRTLSWQGAPSGGASTTVTAAPYYYLAHVTCCNASGEPLTPANTLSGSATTTAPSVSSNAAAFTNIPVFLALAYDETKGWVDISGVTIASNRVTRLWQNDVTKNVAVADTMLRAVAVSAISAGTAIPALGGATVVCWPLSSFDALLLQNPKAYFASATTFNSSVVQMSARNYAQMGTLKMPPVTWTVPNPLDATVPASSSTVAVTFPIAGSSATVTYNVPQSSIYSLASIPYSSGDLGAINLPQFFVTTSSSQSASGYLSFVTDICKVYSSNVAGNYGGAYYLVLNPTAVLSEQVWVAVTPVRSSTPGALTSYTAWQGNGADGNTPMSIALDGTGKNIVVTAMCSFDQSANGASAQWCSCGTITPLGISAGKLSTGWLSDLATKGIPSSGDLAGAQRQLIGVVEGVVAGTGQFFHGQLGTYLVSPLPQVTAAQLTQNPMNIMSVVNNAFFSIYSGRLGSLLYSNGAMKKGYCSVQKPGNDLQNLLNTWNKATTSGALIRIAFFDTKGGVAGEGVLVLSSSVQPFMPYYDVTQSTHMKLLLVNNDGSVVNVPLNLSGGQYGAIMPFTYTPGTAGLFNDEQLILVVKNSVDGIWNAAQALKKGAHKVHGFFSSISNFLTGLF